MTTTSLTPRRGETGADWVRRVLKQESDRDKQRNIGPSDISDMCDYCLGAKLVRTAPSGQGRYWLGARIGTAIHLDLEQTTTGVPGVVPETKVTIGDLPGYGTIRGTSDSFWVDEKVCVDFKTTQRDKLKWIKQAHTTEFDPLEMTSLTQARRKVMSYIVQTSLYARAVGAERISIVYLCRDGKTDQDIWSHEFDYNPAIAEAAWERLERLWDVAQRDGVDSLPSDGYCYTCTINGRI